MAYFSAAKRLFAARNRFGLLPLLTFHKTPSTLDEQYGRSGLIRGYERSFDTVDVPRKVWWPFNYPNVKTWLLFSSDGHKPQGSDHQLCYWGLQPYQSGECHQH